MRTEALGCLAIAIVMAILGFGVIEGAAAAIAEVLSLAYLALVVVSCVLGRRWGLMPGPPHRSLKARAETRYLRTLMCDDLAVDLRDRLRQPMQVSEQHHTAR